MDTVAPRLTAARSGRIPAAALIVVLAAIAYSPLPRNGYISFDDPQVVYENPAVTAGLGRAALEHAFSTRDEASYFQPLSLLSLAADRSVFGLDPRGFHAVSWALHVTTALVLLLALVAATGRIAAATATAVVFVAHPVNVEAVAWAAERRTVLAGLLGLAACVAYARWSRSGRAGAYAGALAAFGLSLLAKPMLVPFPLMLLALDVWPLRRVEGEGRARWTRLLLEKAPFAVLSAASAAVTLATTARMPAQLHRGLGLRAANAAVALVRQAGHVVYPGDLTIFYPYPERAPAAWPVAVAAVVAVTVACLRLRRHAPWWLAGWCWFVAALLPTLGLRQAGWWPLLADRHVYLAALGPVAAACCQVDAWLAPRGARVQRMALAGAVAAGLVLAGLAARQVTWWRDDVTLMKRAVAYAPEDLELRYHLGVGLAQAGEYGAAEPHLRLSAAGCLDASVECSRAPDIFANLSAVCAENGRLDDALRWGRRAVQSNPESPQALLNLAQLLHEAGRLPEALPLYEAFVRVAPPKLQPFRDEAVETIRLARAQGL